MKLAGPLSELTLLAGLLCLAVGCAGVYTSPHGNFEVPIPAMGKGAKVQELLDETQGHVVFHDASGLIKSIAYYRMPDEMDDAPVSPVPPEAVLRFFLHDLALPYMFRNAAPDAEIMTEVPTGDGAAPEYFAVVRIPEGSTVVNLSTGERWDSQRALLIFIRNHYLYMLSYASDRPFGYASVETFEGTAREALNEFRSTIRFR